MAILHFSLKRIPGSNKIFICAIAVVMSSMAFGQIKDKRVEQNKIVSYNQAEQEIMNVEMELVKAGLRGDAAAVDRLMADEYFFMTRDGVVHENLKANLLVKMKLGESKVDLLASLKSGEGEETKTQPATIEDAQVHVYGDTGVVIVRSVYKSQGKDGKVVEIPTRFMHVWGRRQGHWQLVAGSSTRIE